MSKNFGVLFDAVCGESGESVGWSRTMSRSGPPDACATGTAPAAMYSTMHIPKCSSIIVCMPTEARDNSRLTCSYDASTRNCTLSASSKSFTLCCMSAKRSRSASSRQLPTKTSTALSIFCVLFLDFFIAFQAASCMTCAFSGRNCPTLTTRKRALSFFTG